MEAQVQKAVDCYNAGATVLHVHVREPTARAASACQVQRTARRDPQGGAGHDPGRRLDQLRARTDGAAAKWLSDDTRHMLAELEPTPDQVTVTVNTSQMNIGEQFEVATSPAPRMADPDNRRPTRRWSCRRTRAFRGSMCAA